MRQWLRKAVATLLPWPPKDERRAAISGAQREREKSEAAAAKAADLEHQIRRMTADNNFAQLIASQIRGQSRHQGGR